MPRKSPKVSYARRAKDIATRRAHAGLGDLVMDETNESETTRTRYHQPAYGPIRKTVTKKKNTSRSAY